MRENLIEANQGEYGPDYDALRFVTPEEAEKAERERAGLIAAMDGPLKFIHGGTKPHTGPLSPGCAICGQGGWSCLFINGKCNGTCFYCPAPQKGTGQPGTNNLTFQTPQDYLDYCSTADIAGVGISGGEPLLTPDRTLAFLSAVKKRFGGRVHAWLYTNGILLDREMALRLAGAGLDEIRFDIGAVGYHLNGVRKAVGEIPTVTVEIPAVPEDFGLMKQKMKEMHEAGVKHLNLHQLRLTPHNLQKLAARGYTFLHGERVTVLESELAALALMRHALAEGIPLPVNYCSFPYKSRFQGRAARARAARFAMKGHDSLTRAGFIRRLKAAGPQEEVRRLAESLAASPCSPALWEHDPKAGRVLFHPELWELARRPGLGICASYLESAFSSAISYRHAYQEVRFNKRMRAYVENRLKEKDIPIPAALCDSFFAAFLAGLPPSGAPPPELAPFAPYENMEQGLSEYF